MPFPPSLCVMSHSAPILCPIVLAYSGFLVVQTSCLAVPVYPRQPKFSRTAELVGMGHKLPLKMKARFDPDLLSS